MDLARAADQLNSLIEKRAKRREAVTRHRDLCLVGERRQRVEEDLQRMADDAEGGGGPT